jgi:hypothetical protein
MTYYSFFSPHYQDFPQRVVLEFKMTLTCQPGVDVMTTIFCDFSQFSAKKLAFFSNTNVMIKIFA